MYPNLQAPLFERCCCINHPNGCHPGKYHMHYGNRMQGVTCDIYPGSKFELVSDGLETWIVFARTI